jgi:hypothetical protein
VGTEPIFRSYQARAAAARRQLREEYAGDVIREFEPIFAAFGFTQSGWSYDKDLDMIQVYFKDSRRRHAVQIDCDTRRDTFTANYCRQDGEWEICSEGKPKTFIALKKTVGRWLRNNCEECCIDCPTRDEAWEAERYA